MDHLLAIQRADREHHQRHRLLRRTLAERPRGAAEPAQRLGPACMAVAVGPPLLDQQQVQLAAAIEAQQVMAETALDLQAQSRTLFGEARQHRHQHFAGEVFRHAEAQHAVAMGRAEGLAGLVREPQQAPRVAKQTLAFLGRQNLPLAAVEQAATEVLFEADDLLADGGLGQVQVFAGAGEVAGVDNADEGTEQDQIEHAHSH